jgi:hypothetical protein
MTEVKKPRGKRGPKRSSKGRPPRPRYQHRPFATSVTVYSPDGSPVPESVLSQIEVYIGSVAAQNNLLTAVNRASS